MLQEKHWISLKTAPTAIPINFSNTGYQKGLARTFQFFEVCKFVDIFMETFIKVFSVYLFSLPYEP